MCGVVYGFASGTVYPIIGNIGFPIFLGIPIGLVAGVGAAAGKGNPARSRTIATAVLLLFSVPLTALALHGSLSWIWPMILIVPMIAHQWLAGDPTPGLSGTWFGADPVRYKAALRALPIATLAAALIHLNLA